MFLAAEFHVNTPGYVFSLPQPKLAYCFLGLAVLLVLLAFVIFHVGAKSEAASTTGRLTAAVSPAAGGLTQTPTISFPDGETEGGVHQILRTLIRQNGEEIEASLPRAIEHDLTTTNRYIDFAEKESLLRRDQVRMHPGVKLTQFGIHYAESKRIR